MRVAWALVKLFLVLLLWLLMWVLTFPLHVISVVMGWAWLAALRHEMDSEILYYMNKLVK